MVLYKHIIYIVFPTLATKSHKRTNFKINIQITNTGVYLKLYEIPCFTQS